MAFYIDKAIFINRAPFEHLELDFKEKGINVLTAINGKGKTTILSHIVDAFYELARPNFENEFEGRSNKYYRISSPVFNIIPSNPSFVYFIFNNNGERWDYLDIRNVCSENDYEANINIDNKIPFNEFAQELKEGMNVKRWCKSAQRDSVIKLFNQNILTFFPSYRYEDPGYLNDTYSFKIEHKIESGYSGFLTNPLVVMCQFKVLANWLLDVALDEVRQSQKQNIIWNQLSPFLRRGANGNNVLEDNQTTRNLINSLISLASYSQQDILKNTNQVIGHVLMSKYPQRLLKLGVGDRARGGTRINIVDASDETIVYPSIFNMSSGEKALVSIFVELLRQMDNIRIKVNEISGIVLIDEIDKNLHISMQYDILPKLLNMFPNIQFIVTSHSPFLNMGLANDAKERSQIIDLDNNGFVCEPTNNDLYREVYNLMISENQRFADRYNKLVNQIKSNTKPLIITEGKTDYRHIKKAIQVLDRNDIDVEFYEVPDCWGSSQLKEMLDQLSKIKHQRIIIGVFDRDEPSYLSYLDANNQSYKTYGDSNVYAFAIPLVNEDIYGYSISIEHYYDRDCLLKEEPEHHRRLFLGSEFYKSGNSTDGEYQTRASKLQHKVDINGVIDEKVYSKDDLEQLNSIALTKEAFISLIENDENYSRGFDFTNFNQILNVIAQIVNLPLN